MIRHRRHQRIFFQAPSVELSDVINLIEDGLSSFGSRDHHLTRPQTGTALQIKLLRQERLFHVRVHIVGILDFLSAQVTVMFNERKLAIPVLFRV